METITVVFLSMSAMLFELSKLVCIADFFSPHCLLPQASLHFLVFFVTAGVPLRHFVSRYATVAVALMPVHPAADPKQQVFLKHLSAPRLSLHFPRATLKNIMKGTATRNLDYKSYFHAFRIISYTNGKIPRGHFLYHLPGQ